MPKRPWHNDSAPCDDQQRWFFGETIHSINGPLEYGWRTPAKKLDMGKSCIRMKDVNDIPCELIGWTCEKNYASWMDTNVRASGSFTMKLHLLYFSALFLLFGLNLFSMHDRHEKKDGEVEYDLLQQNYISVNKPIFEGQAQVRRNGRQPRRKKSKPCRKHIASRMKEVKAETFIGAHKTCELLLRLYHIPPH